MVLCMAIVCCFVSLPMNPVICMLDLQVNALKQFGFYVCIVINHGAIYKISYDYWGHVKDCKYACPTAKVLFVIKYD